MLENIKATFYNTSSKLNMFLGMPGDEGPRGPYGIDGKWITKIIESDMK